MIKAKHILWLGAIALAILATGCPVDVNEGTGGGDDDDAPAPECPSAQLATVRIFHAAGGTPVTRPEFGPSSTRNLNVVRTDAPGATADKPLTVASLAAGRATLVQLCGNKTITLGARLAGAKVDRTTTTVMLTPDADPSKFDAQMTIVLAGIADTLKADGMPENPASTANPLTFIKVPDTFSTGTETQIQVVHASRIVPSPVDVEANPDRAGVEFTGLTRYNFTAVDATRGTADTAPKTVVVQFLDGTAVKATHTITPRLPVGAKALAIEFDREVYDPTNPDPSTIPSNRAQLFVTGDDPLLGFVSGGGLQF
jgi:hypothetical protein